MVRRFLIVLALLVLGTATAASAQTYPPPPAQGSVGDNSVAPGDTQTATASGFLPLGDVHWVLNSTPVDLGSTKADANGVASITFKVPNNFEPGTHRLDASGLSKTGQQMTVSSTFTVEGVQGVTVANPQAAPQNTPTGSATGSESAPASSGTASGSTALPRTGSSATVPMLRIGIAAIAVGLLIVLAVRKRRTRVAVEAD